LKFEAKFESEEVAAVNLLSKSALAEELGVAASTVSRYVNMGMPVEAAGMIDPATARQWIKDHIRVQAGARGVGARAARQMKPKEDGNAGLDDDPVREHARLTRLRADKLEREIARLAGGTEVEYAADMGEAVSRRIWWEFQAAHADGFAYTLAILVGQKHNVELLHLFTQLLREREARIMVAVHEIICDGFVPGVIEPDRGGRALGTPWNPIVPKRPRTEVRRFDENAPPPPRREAGNA
jgi:hypothetical protein